MKLISAKYDLTDSEVLENPFISSEKRGLPLYEYVADVLGFDTKLPEIRYDCRKINVSKNIQDSWYENYSGDSTGLSMSICCSGPKVDNTLPSNQIEVFDGFVAYEKEGDE